jgi:Bacterial low temperature requirement A protein (LtrA)
VGILAVGVTCGLWWSYFVTAKPLLDDAIRRRDQADRTHLARDVYSILHYVVVFGVVLLAVGRCPVRGRHRRRAPPQRQRAVGQTVGDPWRRRRWKEPSNPATATTSTPSRTKRHPSKPTTRSRGSPSTLPSSPASSAAGSPSRSQAGSSRQSTWSGIPTPRPLRSCGSATSALLGWRRSSPRNPPELPEPSGCEDGRSGHVAAVPHRALTVGRRRAFTGVHGRCPCRPSGSTGPYGAVRGCFPSSR